MQTQEMLENLREIKQLKSTFSSGRALFAYTMSHADFRKKLSELSMALLHTQLSGCESCFMDTYIRLVRISEEEAIKVLECKYKLKDGCLLYTDEGGVISMYNITNENAKAHLLKHPADLQWLDSYPADWNVEEEKVPKQKKAKGKKK